MEEMKRVVLSRQCSALEEEKEKATTKPAIQLIQRVAITTNILLDRRNAPRQLESKVQMPTERPTQQSKAF